MGLFDIFKKKPVEEKQSRTFTSIFGTGTAHWSSKDYHNFSKEGYLKNLIVFRCIDYLSKAVGTVKWEVYQIDSNGEKIKIEIPEINTLLRKPNPYQSLSFFMQSIMSYLLIAGNCYVEKVGVLTRKISFPKELYILDPSKMKINTSKTLGVLESYVYNDEIVFPVDPITQKSDILHLKFFHPIDPLFGASIIEPLSREIDTSNEASEWQKSLLENQARPGMIFSSKGFMTDPQFDRMKKQLNDKFTGSGNAGKNLLLESEGGVDAVPYSWSPAEMDFIESNREMARKISLGFGVPPMLLGIPGDNTYSNMKEARQSFWEDTVIYYLNFIKEGFDDWLFPSTTIELEPCLNDVPALAPKREMLWNMAQTSDFLTINEKRQLIGYEKIEGGDVLLVQSSLMPVEQIGMEEENDDGLSEDESAIQNLIDQGYTREEAEQMIGLREEEEEEEEEEIE